MKDYKFVKFLLVIALFALSCSGETKRMDSYVVHGIDVSHHQQKIDWSLIAKQEIDFAFVKATEGTDHRDTLFAKYWKDIKEAKISRGAYHFFSPYSSAAGQARNFIDVVDLNPGDLPPVLDVEISGKLDDPTLGQNVLEWMSIIERHYHVKPILYTNQKFYMRVFTGEKFSSYPLWIARYKSKNPPFIPFGRNWTFWQYGDHGQLNGIDGFVDFNVFYGGKKAFQKLLIKPALTQK